MININNELAIRLSDVGITGKIFCISMQRSGTSSVGDFLEQWGLKRAGHPLSQKSGWSRCWYDGDYEGIFSSDTFKEHDVYEDDPFWFPDFYKFVYHRVPDSRFILLYRDSDAWFKSMVRHSFGYTLGRTHLHAKIYRREEDLRWLEMNIDNFKGHVPKGMTLYDKAEHYKSTYERHTVEVKDFFRGQRSKYLFIANLSDPATWSNMREWLGLPMHDGIRLESHAHKARSEFTSAHLLKRP